MNYFSQRQIKEIIRHALKEDIGSKDITTQTFVPQDKYVQAVLRAKEDGLICGLDIARQVFSLQDKNIKFKPQVSEGQGIKKGETIARISGRAQSILTAERVALNFLSLLSGIATRTRMYVNKVKPYKARIMDTRKTIPGLRDLEKYAVRIGGGYNHRMRLDEMLLIKDNHLKVRGLKNIIETMRKKIPRGIKLEIEVENLRDFKAALRLGPDIIMLDNMPLSQIKKALSLRKGAKPKIEASGNVNLNNIREIAHSGVEMISIGALTHSIKAMDISLEIL